MKQSSLSKAAGVLLIFGLIAGAANAQAIQKSTEAFVEVQTLPFAPPVLSKPAIEQQPALSLAQPLHVAAPVSSVTQVVVETVQAPSPPAEVWSVTSGSLLSDTMRDWTKQAGWSLFWGLSETEDFRMDAGNKFQGDFKTAITALFNSIPHHIRVRAELIPDNSPPLLHINREQGTN